MDVNNTNDSLLTYYKFDGAEGEYYLYLNGDKKTNIYLPGNETSFSSGHF